LTNVDIAFALLKDHDGEFWRLRRRDGRWYLAMSKNEVVLAALFGGLVTPDVSKQIEKAEEVLRESRTVDEFAVKLHKLKDESTALENEKIRNAK